MNQAVEGTVLGFDYGSKRIGIAVGQTISASARGLTTLQSRHEKPDWEAIGKLIEEWHPSALIVGLPLHMDGSEQELTQKVERFVRQLEGRYRLPVFSVDERLTSLEAESILEDNLGHRRFAAEEIDKLAAQLILEDWLRQQTRK